MQLKRALAGAALGALFVGSTLAAAVTLGDFPQPFVKDGQVKGLIVVGAQAQPADVVAAIDLAARLGSEATVEKTVTWSGSSGGDVSVTGGVSLDNPSERLYLGSALNAVRDVITGKDLSILGKRTFEDDAGATYDYTMYVEVGSNTFQFGQAEGETSNDPTVQVPLGTGTGNYFYKAKVDFNKQVDFTSTDVEGEQIELFGKEFTVAPDTDNTKLVLYTSSTQVSLQKDEEKTVEVGGTSYTIKVIGFDTANDKVVVSVGTDTNDIQEGTSKRVGGLQIFAKSVTAWDNGNQGIAVLQVGSEKVVLQDGQPVKVGDNEENVDGTEVQFNGGGGNPSSLSSIEVYVYKPGTDNEYLTAGETFVDPVFGTFQVTFAGVVPNFKDDSRDKIKLGTSGDYRGYVQFKDINGNDATVYFVKGSSSADNALSMQDDDDKNVYVLEGAPAAADEVVFLAPGKARYTHLVKVDTIYTDGTNGYVRFKDVVTGETYETEKGAFTNVNDQVNLIVDGKTYVVTLSSTSPEKVTVEYADSKTVVYPTLETRNGAELALVDDVTVPAATVNAAGDAWVTLVLPTGEIKVRSVDQTGAGNADQLEIDTNLDGTADFTVDEGSATEAEFAVGSVRYEIVVANDGTQDNGDVGDVTVRVDEDQSATDTTTDGISDPAVLLIEEGDDNNVQNAVVVTSADSGGTGQSLVGFNVPVFTGTASSSATSDSDVTAWMDVYGTYVERDASDSDHEVVTLWYPDNQVYMAVGVTTTDGSVTIGGGTEGGSVTYKEAQPVKVAVAKLDTEVTDADKQNKDMILVGGTTVNSLVRELANGGKLDEAWDGSQWTLAPGEAVIKLVEDAFAQGHVALVVAGTEAADTREAVHVLQNYDDNMDKLSGKTVVKVVNGVVQDFA